MLSGCVFRYPTKATLSTSDERQVPTLAIQDVSRELGGGSDAPRRAAPPLRCGSANADAGRTFVSRVCRQTYVVKLEPGQLADVFSANLQRMSSALTFAEPKTASSRRTVTLGASTMEALRRHRVAQNAERLRVGTAWQDEDLIYATEIGTPIDAGNFLTRTHYPRLKRLGPAARPVPRSASHRGDAAPRGWRSPPRCGRAPRSRQSCASDEHLRTRHGADAERRDGRYGARARGVTEVALLHSAATERPCQVRQGRFCCEPGGIRTHDQGIKSPLLYR
jgi:hypothetical protein